MADYRQLREHSIYSFVDDLADLATVFDVNMIDTIYNAIPGALTASALGRLGQGVYDWATGDELPQMVPLPATPPNPPLVGVEPNPGPARRNKKAAKALVAKMKRSKTRQTSPLGSMVPSQKSMPTRSAPTQSYQSMQHSVAFGNAVFENRRGLRLVGRQRLCDVSTTTDTVLRFTNAAPSGGIATNQAVYVNPSAFGGDLCDIGFSFMSYRFRRLRFTFQPFSSTSLGVGVMFAFNPDAGGTTAPTNSGLTQLQNCKQAAIWDTTTVDASPDLDESRVFFVYTANYGTPASPAEARLFAQGIFLMGNSINGSALATGNTYGSVWIDYDIELYTLGAEALIQLSSKELDGKIAGHIRKTKMLIQERDARKDLELKRAVELDKEVHEVEEVIEDFKELLSTRNEQAALGKDAASRQGVGASPDARGALTGRLSRLPQYVP